MTRLMDITGNRYGNLVAVKRVPRQPGDKHTKWLLQCDCGEKTVSTYINIKTGNTTSCGCKRKPHGMTNTPTWRCWHSMMMRCVWKSNSPRYQGIISVCERWQNYQLFFADMGERPSLKHSLDRIDNAKGYEPGNVRWATMKQQCRNKTNNHLITIKEETKTITEWSEIAKVSTTTLAKYEKKHGEIETYPTIANKWSVI